MNKTYRYKDLLKNWIRYPIKEFSPVNNHIRYAGVDVGWAPSFFLYRYERSSNEENVHLQ